MTINDFSEKMSEQYDDLAPEALGVDIKFREVGDYSSIVALSILAMIDEEYGVTVTGDDMKKCHTVGDLFNLVSSRL